MGIQNAESSELGVSLCVVDQEKLMEAARTFSGSALPAPITTSKTSATTETHLRPLNLHALLNNTHQTHSYHSRVKKWASGAKKQ